MHAVCMVRALHSVSVGQLHSCIMAAMDRGLRMILPAAEALSKHSSGTPGIVYSLQATDDTRWQLTSILVNDIVLVLLRC
jgi:hypothetical protein